MFHLNSGALYLSTRPPTERGEFEGHPFPGRCSHLFRALAFKWPKAGKREHLIQRGFHRQHPGMESLLPPLTGGTLYLVATPIGNLEDITLRALRTLKECDVIAAEDTRHTGRLLQHFGITKPMISYFKFNEARRSQEITARLQAGEKIALVTDAGTPGISDPGERVVRAVLNAGLRVEPVPGACALVAAISASGLATGEFHFAGFLPHKSGQRRRELERISHYEGTLVLYESPYRIEKLISELAEVFPDREVVLARELTKKFEEFVRGTPPELLVKAGTQKLKGEFVVLIGPAANRAEETGGEAKAVLN